MAQGVAAGRTHTTATRAQALPPSPPGAGLVAIDGTGFGPTGLEGPSYRGEHCSYRHDGIWVLPDPSCTPGAVDLAVTEGDLRSTICRRGGWSSSVRPPESLTEPAKLDAMRAYGAPGPPRDYEFDHLVPLGLGGASDTRNLWPEPDQGSPSQFDPAAPYGHNAKDGVEDALHEAVCQGRVGLEAAQLAIAKDWPKALERLGLP